jgi:hypothetical protein
MKELIIIFKAELIKLLIFITVFSSSLVYVSAQTSMDVAKWLDHIINILKF